MHGRDGATHKSGAAKFPPHHAFRFIPKVKRKPQRGERENNRQQDGQRHDKKIKLACGSQSHGCHSDVVEGSDPAAHDDAADQRVMQTHAFPAY